MYIYIDRLNFSISPFSYKPDANDFTRLKDSDVTWLYGPLHTADNPPTAPTPKPSPNTAAALDLPVISSSPLPTKPILKHRSIMDLLTSDMHSSPMFSPPDEDEDAPFHVQSDHEPPKQLTGPGVAGVTKRPPLMHTKSDTHISRCGTNGAFRRDSPPRIIASGTPVQSEKPLTTPKGSSDAVIVPGQKRKHISFNTFVEQCIAIEKPKKKRMMWNVEYLNSKTLDSSGNCEGYGAEDDGSVSGCSFIEVHLFLSIHRFVLTGMTRTPKMGLLSMKLMSFFLEMKTIILIRSHIPKLPHLRILLHIHTLHRRKMPLLCHLLLLRKKTKTKSLRCALGIPATCPHPPLVLPLTLPPPPHLLLLGPARPKLVPHHIRIAQTLITLPCIIGNQVLVPSCAHVVQIRSSLLLRSLHPLS